MQAVTSSRQQGAAGTGGGRICRRRAAALPTLVMWPPSRGEAGGQSRGCRSGADARSRSRGSRTAGGGVVEMSGRGGCLLERLEFGRCSGVPPSRELERQRARFSGLRGWWAGRLRVRECWWAGSEELPPYNFGPRPGLQPPQPGPRIRPIPRVAAREFFHVVPVGISRCYTRTS
jgi:hypothetical protein